MIYFNFSIFCVCDKILYICFGNPTIFTEDLPLPPTTTLYLPIYQLFITTISPRIHSLNHYSPINTSHQNHSPSPKGENVENKVESLQLFPMSCHNQVDEPSSVELPIVTKACPGLLQLSPQYGMPLPTVTQLKDIFQLRLNFTILSQSSSRHLPISPSPLGQSLPSRRGSLGIHLVSLLQLHVPLILSASFFILCCATFGFFCS